MANSPARAALDVGSVVGGTYTLEALIGRGGMGAVFRASHQRLPSKKVAIKLLHVELHDPEVIARFRREATIASELDHPNIVRVDDYNVTDDGTPYLVLEYLQGESLAARIARGPMPLDHVTSIVRQVASALAAAHRAGIVHRDLKPQNIFLVPMEVDGRVVEIAKVLDFGISKIRGSQTVQTQESTLLGTPQYMAPEQATGQHASVDERTDIFALGAIVYEMVCGQPAFTGQSIPEVVFKVVYEPAPSLAARADVPATLVAAVEQAMAKPADQRFPTMSTFVEALTGQPLPPPRASLAHIPEVGFANGSRREDAFARTVDSGQLARDATVAPPTQPPSPSHAPTLASQARGELAPTPAPPVRRGRLLVPLAFGVVVAGAIVGFVALRGERASPRDATADAGGTAPPNVVAVAPTDADVAAEAPAPSDARDLRDAAVPPPDDARGAAVAPPEAASVAVTPADAAAPPRSRPAPRPSSASSPGTGEPPADDKEDDATRGKLDAAMAAFASGAYDKAERLANEVIDATTAPKPLSRALALRGAIHCIAHNSQGRALADWRAISVRRWKRWLAAACRRAGIELR